MGPRDRLKKASGFDFECSSNIQPRLKKSSSSHLYLCKG